MGTPLYRPRNVVHNNLTAYTTIQVIGYVEPTELLDQNKLNQKIYNFLLRSIREEDQRNGKLLERYLSGPQSVWETIQGRIFALKTLWDVASIEDELLVYLKDIVGWTKDLNHITERMDEEQLRRLISVSVALWKAKGTEEAIEDLIRFILQARVRVLNWFDYRWLIDEGYIDSGTQGGDTWLLDAPEDGSEQNYSVLKIADNGELDRTLVKYMVGLLRSAGERIEIQYLKFMDLFDTEGNESQWTAYDGGVEAPISLVVEGGTAKMSRSITEQSMVISDRSTFIWGDYAVSARIRANAASTGRYGLWIHGQEAWTGPGYPVLGHEVYLDPANNLVHFGATSVSFAPWGNLYPDVYYNLMVRAFDVDGTNSQYEVFIDGELIMSVVTSDYRYGYIGVKHEIGAVFDVDGIEVAPIPPETELVDINS